ncbi:MAG TPA: hypothetical protein VEA99_16055, partial [Gemmatimonadaceae bacterium]|nr:hypothetical protein [Gemmatimonadaceae bacterium]
ASSQEQSASTEEIAAAATTLSSAAERLQRLVTNLRVEAETPATPDAQPPVQAPDGALTSRYGVEALAGR